MRNITPKTVRGYAKRHFRLWSNLVDSHSNRTNKTTPSEILAPQIIMEARLLISELTASNNTKLEDEDVDHPDWIELFNAGVRFHHVANQFSRRLERWADCTYGKTGFGEHNRK